MHRWIITLLCLFVAVPALASDVIIKHIPNADVVGSGSLSVMIWDVYDATLYAPNGTWNQAEPFALDIEYKRSIDGVEIADRSAEEIRKLGYNDEVKLAAWHSQMRGFFPDVTSGTKLIGLYTPGKPTVFYHDSKRVGAIQDPEFGKWFFDIWLSENSPDPSLRAALLGK